MTITTGKKLNRKKKKSKKDIVLTYECKEEQEKLDRVFDLIFDEVMKRREVENSL